MTKRELAVALGARVGIPRVQAERVVDAVFDSMKRALLLGEGIEIRGFGSFQVREYKGYAGHNPKTGEDVEVRAKRLPHFKPGAPLRALVDGERSSR